jgi:hypothetical protein
VTSPAAEKNNRIARFRKIAAGDVVFPLRCGWCRSTELMGAVVQAFGNAGYYEAVSCNSCGRLTPTKAAHKIRQNEIRQFILNGEMP